VIAWLVAGETIAALLLGYVADMRRDDNVSATSTLAAIATLGLGAVAATGHLALASVGAGAMLILLASRDLLHRAVALTSESDIQALLRLVLVVLVVLPLLPDAAMGPYGALNPRRLWTVVVVTVGFSFTGYALVRILGPRRGALVNAGWLFVGLRRAGAYAPSPGWGLFALRVGFATLLLGVWLGWGSWAIDWVGLGHRPWLRVAWLVAFLVGAVLIYFAALAVMGLRLRQFARRG